MSEPAEREIRILALREGGFVLFRGGSDPDRFNPPAKATSTLAEVLDYVGEIMSPPVGSGSQLADATPKSNPRGQ